MVKLSICMDGILWQGVLRDYTLDQADPSCAYLLTLSYWIKGKIPPPSENEKYFILRQEEK